MLQTLQDGTNDRNTQAHYTYVQSLEFVSIGSQAAEWFCMNTAWYQVRSPSKNSDWENTVWIILKEANEAVFLLIC